MGTPGRQFISGRGGVLHVSGETSNFSFGTTDNRVAKEGNSRCDFYATSHNRLLNSILSSTTSGAGQLRRTTCLNYYFFITRAIPASYLSVLNCFFFFRRWFKLFGIVFLSNRNNFRYGTWNLDAKVNTWPQRNTGSFPTLNPKCCGKNILTRTNSKELKFKFPFCLCFSIPVYLSNVWGTTSCNF